jgi:hypothetical protein
MIQAKTQGSLQSGLSPNVAATPRQVLPSVASGLTVPNGATLGSGVTAANAAALANSLTAPNGTALANGLAATSAAALTTGLASSNGAALPSGMALPIGTALANGAALASGTAAAGGAALASGLTIASGTAAAGGAALTGGLTIVSSSAPAAGPAVVYHGSAPATSPSLLAQNGVNAYVQLLNALSTAGQNEKSAHQLTNTLLGSSAALKSAYSQALSKLPTALQAKDWRFSASAGTLVFAAGEDELSAQDLLDLKAAFASSNVESAANEVAAAITAMGAKRSSGADIGSPAWGRFDVDDTNFGQVVNLRAYLTDTAPGGKYNPVDASRAAPNTNSNPASHPDIPLTLGGMYLGDLVTTRPDFFKSGFSAQANALLGSDTSLNTQPSEILHGRCSCGEVSFTVPNALDYAFYCHCSRCRVRTGSAFAAVGGVGLDELQVTAGNQYLLIEGECSDGYGARCSRCHVFLFAAVRNRQYAHVSLGVLAGTPSRLPDHHIYVGSKAPWYQITDALPQYVELP